MEGVYKMFIKTFKLTIFLGLMLILASITSPLLIPTANAASTDVERALNYLRGLQTDNGDIGGYSVSTWVVKAIVAAGGDPNTWKTGAGNPSIVDYLKDRVDQIPTLFPFNVANGYATTIMALIDAGEDPTNISGINLVEKLKTYYDGSQIGDPTLVNDDFWGVMALVAAGEPVNSDIIQNTVAFIKNSQQTDGGWGYDVTAMWGTDPDDTAAAIMALIAAAENPSSNPIIDALAYLKSVQGAQGGFTSWGSENADSTAWAIQAIIATGQDPDSAFWEKNGNTPKEFLRSLQNVDGSFNWTSTNPGFLIAQTTAMSIVALMSLPYPIHILALPGGGYSEVQLQALGDAKIMLASGGTVEDAYNLLVEAGIITDMSPANFNEDILIEQYGPQLERYPTFEGRILLLKMLGIDTVEIVMPPQPEAPLEITLTPDEARSEAGRLLNSEGVNAAYTILVQNGLISNELPSISKMSPLYQTLIEQYGPNLGDYTPIEGRVQLLKALGIETIS